MQVACHVHDPTARFKSWDAVFIAVGSSHIGFGSSSDKALARALSRDAAAVQDHKVIPLPGCTVRTVVEHDGRKHAMAVAAPALSRPTENIFAFRDDATRDAFMRAVQVRPLLRMAFTTAVYGDRHCFVVASGLGRLLQFDGTKCRPSRPSCSPKPSVKLL